MLEIGGWRLSRLPTALAQFQTIYACGTGTLSAFEAARYSLDAPLMGWAACFSDIGIPVWGCIPTYLVDAKPCYCPYALPLDANAQPWYALTVRAARRASSEHNA